jgi:hypothetical protein
MESTDLIINFNEYLIINYDKKRVDLFYSVNNGLIKVNYVIKNAVNPSKLQYNNKRSKFRFYISALIYY